MNDYIKQDKIKKLKGYLITAIFILLVFIVCILSYYIYMNIDITKQEKLEPTPTISRTSQKIEELEEENKTISEVIKEINESVVGISKIKNVGNTIFSQDAVSKLGLGTGVIVSENGYILTNEHVSGQKNSTCYITLSNGKTHNGKVIWSNTDIDMAIIKINEKNLPYVALGDSDKIQVGENVYAIGNPIGYEFQRTVTSGIVSALNRTIKLEEDGKETYMEDLIQTDATINPGNSGGPLINIKGEVIGINSIKITSAEAIGFAVPINSVKTVVNSYTNTGNFEEASLGIFAYDTNVVPYINQNTTNAKMEKGIYVVKVGERTTAQKAGIKAGDIILSVDNQELKRMCELRCYIYSKKPKDEITLTIQRNNRQTDIKLTLDKK